MPFLILEYILW